MAIVKIQNQKLIRAAFQEKELAPYKYLDATFVKWQKKTFCNMALPFITWQGHDLRVATELISALKMIGNYAAKMKDVGRPGWNGHAHPLTINTDTKKRVPVYKNHSEPHVQVERLADGYVKWSVQGHYFNDDLPSMAAYVAALTKLIEYAKGI